MFPKFFVFRRWTVGAGVLTLLLALHVGGCVSLRTIASIARAGDTVSMMVGGSEEARKETIDVTLVSEVNGHQEWDLQALGLVRSVFCVRADGRAAGLHYSSYLDQSFSWTYRHEPLQTVLVVDLPTDVPVGPAQVVVDINTTDDSAGIGHPVTLNLEIIAGNGSPDDFARQDFSGTPAAELQRLEPAPYAKITFGDGIQVIGAASLVIDFDESVLDPGSINVYVPQAVVRGGFYNYTYSDLQRMLYWHQDGQQLYLDVVAPQGIPQPYLMAYVMHPPGVSNPGFTLVSATLYDVNGGEIFISGQPSLTYSP